MRFTTTHWGRSMKKYIYDGKEYTDLWILRNEAKKLVFPDDASAALLSRVGISVIVEPDPAPDALAIAKEERARAVEAITVTVDGMEFDGNEDAQRRMTAKLAGWPEGGETAQWVLADNSIANITKAQLQMALELAVARMQELWLAPYESGGAENAG